jgi:PAS domain S-box-containing protein
MSSEAVYRLAFSRAAVPMVILANPGEAYHLGPEHVRGLNDAAHALLGQEDLPGEPPAEALPEQAPASEDRVAEARVTRLFACVPELATAHQRLQAEIRADQAYPEVRLTVTPACKELLGDARVTALNEGAMLLQLEKPSTPEVAGLREQLRMSTEKYRQVVNKANDAIYLFELSENGRPARILEVNEVACRRLGYSRQEYLEMDPVQMDEPGNEEEIAASMERLRQQRSETLEMRHVAKDGTVIPVEVSSHLFEAANRTYHLAIVRDIRERKRAEEQIRTSLEEKTVLLREIHHRVKNNMQLISSLLSLQSQEVRDPVLQDIFGEAQNRIGALALVHEKLYQANDLARVDFYHYVSDLIRPMSEALHTAGTAYRTSVEADPVPLPVPTLIPLALITSELVSNAFKHGLAPFNSGHVTVSLRRAGTLLRLAVADDGIGLPSGFDGAAGRSLGLRLVHTLVEQIQGTLRMESPREDRDADAAQLDSADAGTPVRPGTRFVVEFTAPPERSES